MQRVDLIVDGVRRNVRQLPTNPAFLARVHAAMRTAGRVEVVRSSSAPPPPVPPAARLDPMLQRVVFFAEVTEDAIAGFLSMPPHVVGAVTADPAYRSEALSLLVARSHEAGRVLRPWCDCREPDGDPQGTPFRAALKMAADLGLAEPIGEFESGAEYDHAIANGARLIIGNPSALDDRRLADATARIVAGKLAATGEELRPDAGYSGRGMPLASVTVYTAPGGGKAPLAPFLEVLTPAQRRTFCVYHGAYLTPEEWRMCAAAWSLPVAAGERARPPQ